MDDVEDKTLSVHFKISNFGFELRQIILFCLRLFGFEPIKREFRQLKPVVAPSSSDKVNL